MLIKKKKKKMKFDLRTFRFHSHYNNTDLMSAQMRSAE